MPEGLLVEDRSMKIAICDDEEFQRKTLYNLCEDFASD